MPRVELEAWAKGCEGMTRQQALLEMKSWEELIQRVNSVPCVDSSPLPSPLWAVILTLILQVDKRPWHVPDPLATHPDDPDAPFPHCLRGKSRRVTCANSQTSWAVCLQGLGATPHFSRQVSVVLHPTFLGKDLWIAGQRREARAGRWSARGHPGEGQRACEGRQGWNQKQTQPLHHAAWPGPDSAASGCSGGNWGFGQLGSSLRSQAEELSPHPQTPTWVCLALGQELAGRIWGPAFPSLQGLSAWKETLLCYLWFFVLSPFGSGGEIIIIIIFCGFGSILGLVGPE